MKIRHSKVNACVRPLASTLPFSHDLVVALGIRGLKEDRFLREYTLLANQVGSGCLSFSPFHVSRVL